MKDAISKFVAAMLGPVGFEKAERQNLDEIAKKIKENKRKSLRKLTQTA